MWFSIRPDLLAQQWENDRARRRHYLPDTGRSFLTEVSVDDGRGHVMVLRSFGNSVPLANYAHHVRLPK